MTTTTTGIQRPDFIDLAAQSGDFGPGDAQAPWQSFFGARFSGVTILDVGAGLGHSRARLAGRGNTVLLQDVAPGMPSPSDTTPTAPPLPPRAHGGW